MFLTHWLRSARPVRRPARAPRPLSIEALEDRTVPAATVGVYDENVVAPNTVDFVASGSGMTNTQFATAVATAFAQNRGGVIDGTWLSGVYEYGVSQNRQLRVDQVENLWGIGLPGGGRAISEVGAFATTGSISNEPSSYRRTTLGFSPFGSTPATERVVQFGVTVLSLTGRDYGNAFVTVTLNSGGTMTASRRVNEANGQGDTFYGFAAPTGDYITRVTIGYDGAVTSPDFRLWFDDLGFITANIAANQPPTGVNDSYSVNEDQTLTVNAPGVLGNDTDPDGNALTAVLGAGPAHGQLTLNANGSFTYTPAANYNGPDSFTYRPNDGTIDGNLTTVNLTVNPVNDAPTGTADGYSVDEDQTLTVNAPGVLGNDTDVDGDPLAAALVSGPAHGALTLNANGSFTYVPAADYNGPDGFTYRPRDGAADGAVTTVSLTVNPVNDAPSLDDAGFSIAENSPAGTDVGTVTGSDVDGDDLTYGIEAGNAGGAFEIDPQTGQITVANPAALDYETTPQFVLTVRATDPAGLSADATVTVDLTDVPETVGVAIDIMPGKSPNAINVKSNGKFDVAIFSTSTFDARQVDLDTIRFGHAGTEDSLSRKPHGQPRYQFEDVNGDGRPDLVVSVETERTGFAAGDTRGYLTARTFGGLDLAGEDSVEVKNPGKG